MKLLAPAAGGAALAAAALAAAVLAGCGTAAAPPTTSHAKSAAMAAARSSGPASRTSAPHSVAQPSGGPVPTGFQAASVTFVSAQEAFVLGTAPCEHAPCTSIVRTLDRGVSWRGMPAPVVALGTPLAGAGPAVWGIRFAAPEHGFVFGNGLWVTTDGGEHWSAAAYPGGSIVSLEISDGQVLAVTAHCAQSGCSRWTLLRRELGGGPWTDVAALHGPASIATQARVAAVLDGSRVLVTSDGGLTFASHAGPCAAYGAAALPQVTSVAVEAPRGLALLCTGQGFTGHTVKTVYRSADLGASWTLAGHPPTEGDGGYLAAAAPDQLTLTSASAASWLYYSPDNGKTWRTVITEGDGGQGWNDLGFTTASDGVVVHGHPVYGDMHGQLMLTGNGGLTWQTITF
jgi:hypothetical protein